MKATSTKNLSAVQKQIEAFLHAQKSLEKVVDDQEQIATSLSLLSVLSLSLDLLT